MSDQAIGQFIAQHYMLIGVILWVLSTVISTMPTPDDKTSAGYRWLFNLLHTLAGNAGRIAGARSALSSLTSLVKSGDADAPHQ